MGKRETGVGITAFPHSVRAGWWGQDRHDDPRHKLQILVLARLIVTGLGSSTGRREGAWGKVNLFYQTIKGYRLCTLSTSKHGLARTHTIRVICRRAVH